MGNRSRKWTLSGVPVIALLAVISSSLSAGSSRARERDLGDQTWPLAAVEGQQAGLQTWDVRKRQAIADAIAHGTLPPNVQYFLPPPSQVPAPSDEAIRRIRATTAYYFDTFGRNTPQSFVFSGFEAANPLTHDLDYRWDSLANAGLFDAAKRASLINELKAKGVRNVRLGLPNHLISRGADGQWVDSTWKASDDLIAAFHTAGIGIVLDLHHFGIETQFGQDASGKWLDPHVAFYLNPAWPAYFADFAREAVRRYGDQIQGITIINEPETVSGFNGNFWHGGVPGWGDGEHFPRYYFRRGLAVGTATVRARLAIENYWKSPEYLQAHGGVPGRKLFVHTEALVHKLDYNEFNLYNRFFTSDMMLGQDYLLKADLKTLAALPVNDLIAYLRAHPSQSTTAPGTTILEKMLGDYFLKNSFLNQAPAAQALEAAAVWKDVLTLQSLHLQLATETGKTMATDTVFGADYYSPNEAVSADGKPLSSEPQYYAPQRLQGRRFGMDETLKEYFAHYAMPVMITETGTPYWGYGALWHEQMLLETAGLARAGIPMLGYTAYPAIDTWGWENALSKPKAGSEINPGGLIDVLTGHARAYVSAFLAPLEAALDGG